MKILVVGHYSLDVIHNGPEQVAEREGGLYQAVAMFSALAGKQDRIFPACGVAAEELDTVAARFSTLPGVETAALYPLNVPNHRVHYYRSAYGTRTACVREMVPPISFDRLKKFLDAEGILLNMISGADISLGTLDEIRMAVRGSGTRLHFDYHNLTRGIGPDGERMRRPLPDWRRWAFMIDTLQLNEEEITGLTAEALPEHQTAGHLLTLGSKGVVVTRGREGATLYYNEHKKVARKDFPAGVADGAVETTAAGDVFGAAFFHQYLKSADLFSSCECAVRAATEAVRASV
jgi:sugar/nucleoside kinase (ribokinase family)